MPPAALADSISLSTFCARSIGSARTSWMMRVLNHVRKAVGTEQKEVSRKGVPSNKIHGQGIGGAYRSQNDMTQAMCSGLQGSDEALVHLILHQRVIAGQLFQLPFSVKISAAVTNMAEGEFAVVEDEQLRGATHPLVFRVGL